MIYKLPNTKYLNIRFIKYIYYIILGKMILIRTNKVCYIDRIDVHCTLYNVQCILYSVHCAVYSVQCTLYSVQCTVYIRSLRCVT